MVRHGYQQPVGKGLELENIEHEQEGDEDQDDEDGGGSTAAHEAPYRC